MASPRQTLLPLTRCVFSAAERIPGSFSFAFGRLLAFPCQRRLASTNKKTDKKTDKKKTKHKAFRIHDKSKLEKFSLCDAMRYIRAFEVGRPPASVTYDIALKLQTNKDGAVLRDRIRLPYPCNSDLRIAVICKEGSKTATEAKADGAVAVGEETIIAAIKAGEIDFNRLLCHIDSAPLLMKSGLGPVLGPRGLMPNLKTKTITNDVRGQMRDMAGSENYRERAGVVRMAIGQLGFTPQMLADNIKALIGKIKEDMRKVEHTTPKVVDEVVLSSTNGPGFSLSGAFNPTDDNITPAHLSTVM